MIIILPCKTDTQTNGHDLAGQVIATDHIDPYVVWIIKNSKC